MFRVSNSQLSFSCENAFCTTSFFLNKRFITRWDLTQRITRKEKESCYSQIRERSTIADDGISVGDGISVQGVCEILYPFLARIVFTFFNKIYTLILYSLIYSLKRTLCFLYTFSVPTSTAQSTWKTCIKTYKFNAVYDKFSPNNLFNFMWPIFLLPISCNRSISHPQWIIFVWTVKR